MSGDRGVAESRARALLREQAVTETQKRSACVVLAGRALIAAGSNEEAARGMLREVLEAVGVIPYPVPPGRKQFAAKGGTS